MIRVVINYGKFKQYGALVDIRSLGIVNGKLVRGFTRTGPDSFIYGTVLEDSEVVRYLKE